LTEPCLLFGSKQFTLQYWREENQENNFILSEGNDPRLAMEVKSGRKKKVPSKEVLRSRGIDCPFLVIDRSNILEWLSSTSIEEILSRGKINLTD